MPASSRSSLQSPVVLRSACDDCIAYLRELVGIHFAIDPPDRLIQPTDPDCVYRLRKALLHIKSITSWTIDTDVMHVIAPEIRAAVDEVDNVWKEAVEDLELDDIADEQASKAARLRAKTSRETTSAYVHPSPQRLRLPKEHGGLGPGNDQRYYTTMLDLLFHLSFRYAVALGFLSRRLAVGEELPVVSVMERLAAVVASVKPGRESRVADPAMAPSDGSAHLPGDRETTPPNDRFGGARIR